ncbi:MAG: hypothetical protein OEM02_02085 [Desulfobulbaceae bacterium]|nr:hypothetical protein [Desulfobulbaceae bacterium]
MRQLSYFLFISFFLIILNPYHSQVMASKRIDGEFIASQTCQAYVSMRKKTNPDQSTLSKGNSYNLLEQNVPDSATWYRIRMDEANPSERWVYFECGLANISSTPTQKTKKKKKDKEKEEKGNCSTAGQADSYKFAMSWQPAFCETHRDKPECGETDPQSYAATNFSLHGLWPNKNSCSTHYGFCGEQKQIRGYFCSYPAVPISSETLADLGKVMPSAAAGSCLQRHEWYKHGTCQTTMSSDQYFELAIKFTNEFNQSGMADFMQANIGKKVTSKDFYKVVDTALGKDAHMRMRLGCKNGNLVDIYMNFPKQINNSKTLSELLAEAPEDFSNNCGESFSVDASGF